MKKEFKDVKAGDRFIDTEGASPVVRSVVDIDTEDETFEGDNNYWYSADEVEFLDEVEECEKVKDTLAYETRDFSAISVGNAFRLREEMMKENMVAQNGITVYIDDAMKTNDLFAVKELDPYDFTIKGSNNYWYTPSMIEFVKGFKEEE